ncbi:hypothetical protein [Actinocrispum sp. NPDC049592]|uniref:hypothetical protein n=1 Tax=Actinocrispum sp. NPDC049592 TaxID=3154835 RepID=UPI0034280E77
MSLSTTLLVAVAAVLVVVRVIAKQTKGSVVTTRGLVMVPLIMMVVGVVSAKDVIGAAKPADLLMLGVDVILLIVLGAARGASVAVTERDGAAFQKGTKWTLVLWIATIAVRVGVIFADRALGLDSALTSASVVVTLGVTLAAQNWMIFERARRLGIPVASRG